MNLRRLVSAAVFAAGSAGNLPEQALAQDLTPRSSTPVAPSESQVSPAPAAPSLVSPSQVSPSQVSPEAAPAPNAAPPTDSSRNIGATATSPRASETLEQSRVDAELALRRLVIPEPISPERFAAMLAATDPALVSNKDVAAQFALYRATFERLADDPGRRILQLLPAAYNFDGGRGVFEPRPTPTLVELLSLRDSAARTATDAEKALFRAVTLATPVEGRAKLGFERIAEINLRLPRAGLLPSTALSMREILDRARLSEASRAVIQSTLLSYVDVLTALSMDRARVLQESDAARAEIESAAGILWRYGAAERVAEIDAQLEAIDDREFASEIAIRDAHLVLLRRLRAVLPRPEGRRVVEQWQRTVHPELFDDERILAQLVESVVARTELSADTQSAVLDALDATYARLEPLSDAASLVADRILPRLVERSNNSARTEIAARLDLLELQRKRRILVKDALARIRGIAGSASAETLARFEDLAQTIAALERADRAERAALEALDTEVAAKSDDAWIAPVSSEETTTGSSKPSATGATTPTAPATKNSGGTTGGSSTNRGRGGRGSRNPIND